LTVLVSFLRQPVPVGAALGYDDAERANALLRGAKGKRLLYQWPDEATHA
jgi:hypothetical protein